MFSHGVHIVFDKDMCQLNRQIDLSNRTIKESPKIEMASSIEFNLRPELKRIQCNQIPLKEAADERWNKIHGPLIYLSLN